MQWNFTCILLASIAIISASDHDIRSKRDLSLIKSYVLSKIFGSYEKSTTPIPANPANYRLFRLPGFDNILVKAVPKVPVVLEADAPPTSVLEVTESEPVHPSIAIVSKYLGTNQLNDTLFALRGVKDLLQSGVLTAKREGFDQIAAFKGLLPPVVDEARRPNMVYPSLRETIMGQYRPVQVPRYPYFPIPSKYSYKQINNDGVMSYEAHDNHNVIVTESKRPVAFPPAINYRIQDILSLGTYHLPTSPTMLKGIKTYPAPIPVFDVPNVKVPYQTVEVLPSYIPSGFSYSQLHNDGSVTTYSGSGQVEEHEGDKQVVITKAKNPTMSVVVAEMEGYNVPKVQAPFQAVKASFPRPGYYYDHVHNDGFVTTYSGSGHVVEHEGEKSAVVITEPGRPTVVIADVQGPPAPFPVFNVPKAKVPSESGYTYNHLHNDGSVTTYSGSGHVEQGGEKSAAVITKPGRPNVVVAEAERPPSRFSGFSVSKAQVPSGSGYSYNHVHNDGSVTTYSGFGQVEEHGGERPAFVVSEPGRPTIVVSDAEGPSASFPIFNVPMVKVPSSSGYTYNSVHNDGYVTTYPGSGQDEGKPVVFTEPARPTVVVADAKEPSGPMPVGSGYSYNHIHNDGSVTTYSGSGHVVGNEGGKPAFVVTEPGRPTVVVSDVEGPPAPFPAFNIPKVKVTSGPGYSNNHVRNDGYVTSYSGSGHLVGHGGRKPAVVVTEPGRPTVVVSDVEGPPAPFPVFNIPKVKVTSGPGYSYNHVRNDGYVTSYSGPGHLVGHEGRKPAVVVTEPGRPTVVVSDVEGPPAPFPVFNIPKVKVTSGPGYSYNQVRNDGYVASYSGSGHEGEKPGVVVTEPGRPTVVVSDVQGPPAAFSVFNVPNVEAFDPGYSYNHVRNDGSVTTYSGSGHVEKQEEEKSAVVITDPGRPTVVVGNVEGRPAPFPVFNAPKIQMPSGFGYSYNHLSNDGSVTSYSGSGHVKDHKGETAAVVVTETRQPPPFPTFLASRIENVASSAMAAKPSASLYGPPAPAYHDHAVMVKESPGFVDHVRQNPYEIPHHPKIREQVNVHSTNHNKEHSRPTSNVPSGFSYNTVHQDGSVTSYTDAGVVASAHVMHDRPILYPTGPAVTDNTGKEHLVQTVICKDPAHLQKEFNKKEHSDKFAANLNSSQFSYTTVNEGGSSTTYSGSGHVEHNIVSNAAHIDINPTVANTPLLVTQTDDDNPQKVLLKPVLSQYMYKQINHHNPDKFANGQANVKVSLPNPTVSSKSELQSVEVSKVPKDYVVMPSSTTEQLVPKRKPVERTPNSTKKEEETEFSSSKRPLAAVPTSTKISHSFKPRRVYRHRVRTSTSTSSSISSVSKTSAPLTTTSQVASSTVVTSSEGSLSANPIVVLPEDNVFSFKQDRADGTSITVVGNKENKVSVVEEPKISPNRGDIPDSSF